MAGCSTCPLSGGKIHRWADGPKYSIQPTASQVGEAPWIVTDVTSAWEGAQRHRAGWRLASGTEPFRAQITLHVAWSVVVVWTMSVVGVVMVGVVVNEEGSCGRDVQVVVVMV